MRRFGLALTLAVLPGLAAAGGQEMWTWTDANGTVHYSNVEEFTPSGATPVDSRITVEVDRIPGENESSAGAGVADADAYDPFPPDRRWKFPITDMDSYGPLPFDGGNQFTHRYDGGRVYDSFGEHLGGSNYPSAGGFQPLPDAPRVYDDARLEFGCYTAGVLWAGGFSHANDISGVPNCYPYRLGPRAWLNAAQAELAMRENGINPRDMMQLYMEEVGPRR
jgi:hypothetical protein